MLYYNILQNNWEIEQKLGDLIKKQYISWFYNFTKYLFTEHVFRYRVIGHIVNNNWSISWRNIMSNKKYTQDSCFYILQLFIIIIINNCKIMFIRKYTQYSWRLYFTDINNWYNWLWRNKNKKERCMHFWINTKFHYDTFIQKYTRRFRFLCFTIINYINYQ